MLFFPLPDIHTLENILKNSLFCDKQQPLSISVLEPPKCVLISGLPLDTPEFALKLYVEKLGAEAKYIKFLPPNKAIVEFESWDGEFTCIYTYIQCSERRHLKTQFFCLLHFPEYIA